MSTLGKGLDRSEAAIARKSLGRVIVFEAGDDVARDDSRLSLGTCFSSPPDLVIMINDIDRSSAPRHVTTYPATAVTAAPPIGL